MLTNYALTIYLTSVENQELNFPFEKESFYLVDFEKNIGGTAKWN